MNMNETTLSDLEQVEANIAALRTELAFRELLKCKLCKWAASIGGFSIGVILTVLFI